MEGYELAVELLKKESTCSSSTDSRWWKILWSLKIPSKSCHGIDSPPPKSRSNATDHRWIHSDTGCLKLNTDTTVEDGSLTIGVGIVIRDSVGLVLRAINYGSLTGFEESIVVDIRHYLSLLDDCSVLFVSRLGNMVAHSLAKLSLRSIVD
ncbi:hypothetical protein PanWU01x14_112500 [Parasponia andersonii]|uniref:RNase H type-1 domain-containing protein n=1 Tax=Parasponia andersonii TaxID=3476 RepID=A0A2P5CYA1_PARAD|nr:hypothetical protein PanWU01x14_112500 [Parasponia andersonii]